MISIVVLACVIVFFAIIIDLSSGLYKAKLRKELHRSEALRRTLGKFIMYEGGMLIACGIDVLMHLCRIFKVMHIDVLFGVPIITCIIGIFLLIVEFISVREKADAKTRRQMEKAVQVVEKMVHKEMLIEAFTQALTQMGKEESHGED